ncbi:MAG: hypothetical protein ACREP9_02660, partial [Candidatus Dormibacteraceae bacterium]
MKKLWLPATAVVLTIIAVGVGVFLARPSSSPESVLPGELAPGSALPSDAQCTARVQRNPWEPRPENTQANHTVPPTPYPNPTRSWSSNRANQLKTRVDGQFTGTTDEIIQWSACKWGYPVEVARAQAVDESHWYQSHRSDGGVSYGLFQLKSTVWTGTLPWSQNSTAYNADWAMGVWRACYEG